MSEEATVLSTLSEKHRAFVRHVFKNGEPTQAYIDIYKPKSKGGAAASATRLLKSAKVQQALQELHKQADSDAVADVHERKVVLTQIIRARPADFIDDPTSATNDNAAAISSIRRSDNRWGENITITTESKISAIQELNKMEGIYTEGPPINVDARSVNIQVMTPESKSLTEELMLNGRQVDEE